MLAYYASSLLGVTTLNGESGAFPKDRWVGNYPQFKGNALDELTMVGGIVEKATEEVVLLRRGLISKIVVVKPSDVDNSAILRAKTQQELDADAAAEAVVSASAADKKRAKRWDGKSLTDKLTESKWKGLV